MRSGGSAAPHFCFRVTVRSKNAPIFPFTDPSGTLVWAILEILPLSAWIRPPFPSKTTFCKGHFTSIQQTFTEHLRAGSIGKENTAAFPARGFCSGG